MEQALDIILYILSALLGLAVGSFLNVCIYRLPRGKFFENSRSYCPKCGTPIKAYDNIPLLSYLILGGKCRACHQRISPRYPIVEASNMILWIVNYAVFGMNYITIVYDILVSTLIVVMMVDIDMTEIPDSSIITIIILAILTFIPIFDMSWQSKLIGAFCVSVPMLIIAFFGGMGLGDVKLYFALGLLFGWEKILLVFIMSMVLGSIVGVIHLAYVRHKGDKAVGGADNGANPYEATTNGVRENDPSNGELEPICDADAVADGERVEGDKNGDNLIDIDMSDVDDNDLDKDAEYEKELQEKIDSGKAIPFGPFIVIASMITLYFGDKIIALYKGLLGL